MKWFKKPFSECFGISPGDYASPGLYRVAILSKVILLILVTAMAVYVMYVCSIGVDAATVSSGDAAISPIVTEAPPARTETPEDTSAPSPTPELASSPVPEYVIENEVNLDGANLYSSSDSVTVYTQAVVLASETESETDTSIFPEKSGYFVVPVSDT